MGRGHKSRRDGIDRGGGVNLGAVRGNDLQGTSGVRSVWSLVIAAVVGAIYSWAGIYRERSNKGHC